MAGMIGAAKDTLEAVIKARVPNAIIVRNHAKETKGLMGKKFPLVALITNPGKFDDRTTSTFRYVNTETQALVQRYVRGSRTLPILVRVWAEGEEETDEYFTRIIPAIPREWSYDGFDGNVLIKGEEHSDHTGNAAKQYVSVAEVQFTVKVALEEEVVPTFTSVTQEPEIA
jgi:hypothetical protein